MKLIEIIKHIDFLTNVKIFQMDAYLETSEHYGEEEEVFFGGVLDVPWWIAEMYLYDDADYNSISIDKENNCLEIYVKETLDKS